MKALIVTLILAGTFLARCNADDTNILKNGDFSSGVNHWDGDCHTPDSSSFSDSQTPPTAGVVVKLHGSSWAKVEQDFTSKMGAYNVSITYAASSDLKLSQSVADYVNISGQLGFNGLMPFSTGAGEWVVLINDRAAMHYNFWKITPKLDATGEQTIHLRIQIDSGNDATKGFFLLFPPGQGFINLLNVSITPAT